MVVVETRSEGSRPRQAYPEYSPAGPGRRLARPARTRPAGAAQVSPCGGRPPAPSASSALGRCSQFLPSTPWTDRLPGRCPSQPRLIDEARGEQPVLALSSRTKTDRERPQRVGYDAFARPPANGRYLRTADGRSRRIADVADHGLGRLDWAENAPTGVASGRTGVTEKAVVPLRARNTLHRPSETISIRSAIDRPRPERDIGGHRRHHLRVNG